jgi:hypothetical protein
MRIQASLAVALVLAMIVSGCGRKSSNTSENQSSNTPTQQAAAPPPQAPAPQAPAPQAPAPPASAPPASSPETAPATPVAKAPPPVAAKPTPPPPPKPVVVPAGTSLTIRLDQAISSKTAHQGDTFTATTSAPVVIAGKTAIPAGSRVQGVVTQAKSAGKIHGEGVLAVSLNQLTVHGVTYPIDAEPLSKSQKGKGSRTAKIGGGSAAGGALIGGLAGGGKGAAIGALVGGGAGVAGSAMTGNKELELPAEAALTFRLAQPITLKPGSTPVESAGSRSQVPSDNPPQ